VIPFPLVSSLKLWPNFSFLRILLLARPFDYTWWDQPHNIWRRIQIIKLSLRNVLQYPVTSSLVNFKHLPYNFRLEYPLPTFSLRPSLAPVSQNMVSKQYWSLRGRKKQKTEEKLHTEQFNDSYSSPYIIRKIQSERVRQLDMWPTQETEEVHTEFWWGNVKHSGHFEDRGVDGRIILKWVSEGAGWEGTDWFPLVQGRDKR
jgi:hypothetical protein